MFHTTVKCVDCGALMVDVPSNTKRCAVCRVGHNRESVRKANKTRRAEEAVRPKPRSLDDDLEVLNKYNEQRRAADLKEVAEAFGKTFSRHIAQDIQDERDRRAEETEKAKGGEKQ